MSFIFVILIAISLSMDAFSLALAYGTLNMNNNDIQKLSIIVGIYHFFMPFIGMIAGTRIIQILNMNPNLVVLVVLSVIGLQMIMETTKEERNIKLMTLIEFFFFGLAVSIDSFSVGLGLKTIYKNPLVSMITFSLSSFFFTYLGLKLGRKISNMIGRYATLLGGITLIIIGILYMI